MENKKKHKRKISKSPTTPPKVGHAHSPHLVKQLSNLNFYLEIFYIRKE